MNPKVTDRLPGKLPVACTYVCVFVDEQRLEDNALEGVLGKSDDSWWASKNPKKCQMVRLGTFLASGFPPTQ